MTTQQDYLSQLDTITKYTQDKNLVDLLIRGLQRPYQYMRQSLTDAGYGDIIDLKRYITHIDHRSNTQDEAIIALKDNFAQSQYKDKSKEELENILEQTQQDYDTKKSAITIDPKIMYQIDRVASKTKVSSTTVQAVYTKEYNSRIPALKLIQQWAHALAHTSNSIQQSHQALQAQLDSWYRDDDHPLAQQLSQRQAKITKILGKMDTDGEISIAQVDHMIQLCRATAHLIYNHHYATGWSANDIDEQDTQLVSYIDMMTTILTGYRSLQVTPYQDTMMADYSTHLLKLHQQMQQGIVVDGLPSREAIVDQMRIQLINRNNIVLTGPSGTGKTELAKYLQREMMDDMKLTGQLSESDYEMLYHDLPYLSGNPDATKSELRGKRVSAKDSPSQQDKNNENSSLLTEIHQILSQLSANPEMDGALQENIRKKLWSMSELDINKNNTKLFDYSYSKLEMSIKYGIPIIIDEFLRYPESLLAYLKFFWSRKPWERMTMANGEEITIRTVNFIATTNEGEQYGLYAKDFINREYESIKVDYIVDEELSDLTRAKMLYSPGYVPYVWSEFFAKEWVVHRVIQASKDIAELKFGTTEQSFYTGKLNSNGTFTENTKGKLQSAILDTKRLLACYDLTPNEILTYRPDDAVARKLCKWICSSSSHNNDKYLLIAVLSKLWLINSSHTAYLQSIDKQAMSITDTDWTSIITKNTTIVSAADKKKQISSSTWLTDIAQLAQISLYGVDVSKLPLSSDNPILLRKRWVINSLKAVYMWNQIIADILDELAVAKEITNMQVESLMDKIIMSNGDESVDMIAQINSLSSISWLSKLRDDRRWYTSWKQSIDDRRSTLQSSLPADTPPVIQPLIPSWAIWSLQPLISWSEHKRILQYRNDFVAHIKPHTDNTKTIPQLVALAKNIEKSWAFRLTTQAWLSVGEWNIWGKSRAIANAWSIMTATDRSQDSSHIWEHEYHAILRPRKSYEPTWWSVADTDTTQRPDTVRTRVQPYIDQDMIPMHHTWDDQTHNEFHDVCAAMMLTYNVSEDDALVVMMYLQWLYWRYWVWWDRGYVFLRDGVRWFRSSGNDDSLASLLFSVSRDSAKASPSALAEQQRMIQWRNTSVTNIPLEFLDETTQQPIAMTDNDAARSELDRRCTEFASVYMTQVAPPHWFTGLVNQMVHPDRNTGIVRSSYIGQYDDFMSVNGLTESSSLSHNLWDYAGQRKLNIYLRSIRWDVNKPDSLSDTVNKAWTVAPNYTKAYLQAIHQAQPSIRLETEDQQKQFLQFLAIQLHLPTSNEKLLLIAWQRICHIVGWCRNWTYQNNSRGYVNLGGDHRWFHSGGDGDRHASLLFSRDW